MGRELKRVPLIVVLDWQSPEKIDYQIVIPGKREVVCEGRRKALKILNH